MHAVSNFSISTMLSVSQDLPQSHLDFNSNFMPNVEGTDTHNLFKTMATASEA
jgi:hypothetical protein